VTGASGDPIELRDGVGRKQAFHFGPPDRTLFGFYHPPADGAWRATGVVLCPPIGTDYTRSDRTYRHMAERLAAAGFACLRFDLSGTGDSGGEEAPPGLWRRWVEEIGIATEELRARSGAEAIALVGLRIGATLALQHAVERGTADSLVLWSPCVSGAGFVAEVTKLHKLYTRIEPHLAEAPRPVADGEEALGLFLPRAFIEELSDVDLLRMAGRPAKRTLVIDGGNLASRDSLVAHLRDLGASPELQMHPGHKFLITVSHRSVLPEEPIDSIVRWLSVAHPTRGAPPAPGPRASGPGPSAEKPIVVGDGHPLFGILTPADPERARPGRPAIVLTNAGCVNRSGPHRTYVRMARRWAQMGFDVLRVDLTGIGDSPAGPGEKENLTYPASALDDLRRAIHALGSERAVIAGLCSGGDYAFQLGARDPRVVAAWMLNPRTFCVLELGAVESGAPPATSVDEVPRRLRAMAERGVDTVLVVSRNDPGVAYVDAHAGSDMRALEGVGGYHRFDLAGADHSFTPVMLQERVSDILTERLTALAPGPGGAAR
jgi:alpha-beta hydrolase superfamily lysophospholipase